MCLTRCGVAVIASTALSLFASISVAAPLENLKQGEWETLPQPEAIAQIVASHKALFDGFRC